MTSLPVERAICDADTPYQANSITPNSENGQQKPDPKPDDLDRIRLLEVQNLVLELIAKGASIERSLERLALELANLLRSPVCSIHLLDAAADRMECVAATSLPTSIISALTTLETEMGGPLRRSMAWREPIVIPDIGNDRRCPNFRSAIMSCGYQSVWIEPILDQNGDPLGVIVFLHPQARVPTSNEEGVIDALCPLARIAIEHSQREQALLQADEKLTSLAANLPGVVYQRVVTPEEEIYYTYISEGAYSLFGVSAEEILADPNALFDCHHPNYRENFRERLLAASRDLTMWDVEAPIISRDGKHKWSHAIARPHRQPDGSVVWNGIILDATRLKKSNLELVAANRAKSNFLANMSHELRTPLNAVIGFSEVIQKEQMGPVGNDQYKEYAADIYNSGLHLLKVINEILDLAKIENGSIELNEDDIDVRGIVDKCVHMVRDLALDGNITIRVDCNEDLPLLRADPLKLDQILINLLSNAVKFTPAGGMIVISIAAKPESGLQLKISDTGIGMEPDDVENVIKPFHQADTGLDRKYEGTGLGLALVNGFVQLHGGNLLIESKPNKGTTVTVCFMPDRCVGVQDPKDDTG